MLLGHATLLLASLLPSQDGARSAEELLATIRSQGNKTPDAVFDELCALRTAEALEALVDGLGAVSQPAKRCKAYAATRRLAGVPEVADAAAGFLQREAERGSEVLRLHATLRLGPLWPDSREELLELALELSEPDARAAALLGLVDHAEELTPEELARLARSKDEAVRYEGLLGQLRAGSPELEPDRLLKGRDIAGRLAIVEHLASSTGEDRIDQLEVALDDRDARVVRKALAGLARLPERDAVALLVGRLQDCRPGLRPRIAASLRQLTGEDLGLQPERWARWWADRPVDYTPPGKAPEVAAPEEGETRSSFYGLPVLATEVVFAIDASDSMKRPAKEGGGPSRQELARAELLRALDGLPDDALVDIVSFGKGADSWRGELTELGRRRRRDARRHVETLSLSWGTEIYGGLREALRDPRTDTVVFMTDGDPQLSLMQDRAALRRLVAQWNRTRHTTIDCVSLGGDRAWLRRLAEESGGRYVQVD